MRVMCLAAFVVLCPTSQVAGQALSGPLVGADAVLFASWPGASSVSASTSVLVPRQAEDRARYAGITRFIGAFLGSSVALALITRDDATTKASDYLLHVAGTASGAALVTTAWEKPRAGILAGAAIGSVPILAAVGERPDDVPWPFFLAFVLAPYFATLGQGL